MEKVERGIAVLLVVVWSIRLSASPVEVFCAVVLVIAGVEKRRWRYQADGSASCRVDPEDRYQDFQQGRPPGALAKDRFEIHVEQVR